ncbi:MAG: Y-family DNA polymerase [bacterium]|nr:Y-family DNA polymerase [bacterium]
MPFIRSDKEKESTRQGGKLSAVVHPWYILIDCNNFFVSCERVFDPQLEGRPVLVLSNNDGVIISRSNEAKALGIKMAAPVFQFRDVILKHKVSLRSANFTLYRDLSRRIVHTLRQFCPDVEVYSVDEVFMAIPPMESAAIDTLIRTMRRTVYQWVGVPVGIGVAETKTLAKLAAEYAKKEKSTGGCFDLVACTSEERDRILGRIPVDDIWGIGRQHGEWLRSRGIMTALQLREIDQDRFGKKAGVTGLRTVKELQGISCLSLKREDPPRKMITCSRSFGKRVTDLQELKEAVSTFAAQAGRELRRDGSLAQRLTVYCSVRNKSEEPDDSNTSTMNLPVATDRDSDLIHAAVNGLEKFYREGVEYTKGGITLGRLTPAGSRQEDIFAGEEEERQDKLSHVVDQINSHLGYGTISYAATGTKAGWRSQAELRSPNYTTKWDELPVAYGERKMIGRKR